MKARKLKVANIAKSILAQKLANLASEMGRRGRVPAAVYDN